MPQNRIQFQAGQSLSEFIAHYGTEAQCEEALERTRWPAGFVCPDCGGQAHSTFYVEGRQYWQCSHCRTQTSLLSGTVFQATKLPLNKWFLAEYLIGQNKNNLSALSLKRHLGVSYRTAWRVKHKLLEAMIEAESDRQLHGVVVADDAYLGGVHAGKPGRGSQNKVPFIAAVELNEEGHPFTRQGSLVQSQYRPPYIQQVTRGAEQDEPVLLQCRGRLPPIHSLHALSSTENKEPPKRTTAVAPWPDIQRLRYPWPI